jgi:energy-coupling factor transport system ATP-binding protein
MRHARRGRKLGREAQHRKAMLGTMAGQVITHGRIKTTTPKAKELRGVVDKLINTAKKDDLASRRQAVKVLKDKTVVRRLFEDVAPELDDRNSGYTRILKLGPRLGDGAETVYLERVNSSAEESPNMQNPGTGTRPGGSLAVSCEELTFSYPGSEVPALSEISFELRPGEYVGVVGPNGGGKSTLVRLLNGLLRPDAGQIRVSGHDPASEPFEVRKHLGVLFQNPENGLVAPFVEDDIAFGLENLGVPREEMRERVTRAIRAVGLGGYERREPHTLSGGEKQRVALAGLLAVEPEILVLDEPTSMLDAAGRGEVLERLEALRSKKTVLHVTHHLEELQNADRILVLNGGELVADEIPARLFADPDLLRENRLILPVVSRLALALGLPANLRTPEELAGAISTGNPARTR